MALVLVVVLLLLLSCCLPLRWMAV